MKRANTKLSVIHLERHARHYVIMYSMKTMRSLEM